MRLVSYEIKSMRPIFKTEMLIYQSKADFDEKGLVVKISSFKIQKFRKFG